jgi:hypothetical protein
MTKRSNDTTNSRFRQDLSQSLLDHDHLINEMELGKAMEDDDEQVAYCTLPLSAPLLTITASFQELDDENAVKDTYNNAEEGYDDDEDEVTIDMWRGLLILFVVILYAQQIYINLTINPATPESECWLFVSNAYTLDVISISWLYFCTLTFHRWSILYIWVQLLALVDFMVAVPFLGHCSRAIYILQPVLITSNFVVGCYYIRKLLGKRNTQAYKQVHAQKLG